VADYGNVFKQVTTVASLIFRKLFFSLHLIEAVSNSVIVLSTINSLNIKTNRCTNMYCIILKHTLKHLKSSYMFRSIDHDQGARVVPC
jgi:hypothetical protein